MSYDFFRAWYRSMLFWQIYVFDWFTKNLVPWAINYRSYTFNDFFSFHYSVNRGISWGLLRNCGDFGYSCVTGLIFLLLCFLAKYTTDRQRAGYTVYGETLLLAGGLGNFTDRLAHCGVVDFIKISFGGYSFPVFNCADIAISVGACIILYQTFMGQEPEERE